MWPLRDSNPFMPREPGEHGILFSARQELLCESDAPDFTRTWSVFERKSVDEGHGAATEKGSDSEVVQCRYLGEYKFDKAGTLQVDEFKGLPENVQRNLAKMFLHAPDMSESKTYRMHGLYARARARIALRKYNIFPFALTSNWNTGFSLEQRYKMHELRGAILDAEVKAADSGKGRSLNIEDVLKALRAGDEVRRSKFSALEV